MNLTPKQEKFCQEYIKTGNASEAYRLSYNASNMKPDSVNRKAKELLDNVKITAMLAELAEKVEQVFLVETADLLREAARIAFLDPRKLVHQNGVVKLLHELDDDTAAAVKSFEIDEYGRIKYQFWDKNSGQERLFKYKGLFEADNKQAADALGDLLAGLSGKVLGKADGRSDS